ncbi:MAG: serine/threonine-protein kinase [Planctomycetota bacterium]
MTAFTPERWQRIESLFHTIAGSERQSRGELLQRECGDDHELRAAVERLLDADVDADAFFDGGLARALHGVDPLLQQRFAAFRLVERIAEGGMGTVYRGERADGVFAQDVAVKVLRYGLQTPAMRERFARERRVLAALVHPNVARLMDGGTTENGVPFLVMELVDGVRVDRYCDEQRLSVRTRLSLFVTVCRAVHFVHQNLVVHLDLKPTNILVDRSGPKLVDFGIAGWLEAGHEGHASVAATRNRPLTPEYASPELLHGGPVTTAADVYSLGVVLYELLTGRRAFRAEGGELGLMRAVCETDVSRVSTAFVEGEATDLSPTAYERAEKRSATPRDLRRVLRGDLDRIVAKAVHRDAAERYASCQDLADDVERWLGGFPVRARGASLGYRARRFVGRHAVSVASATAALLALVIGLFSTLHMAAVAGEERDLADAARVRSTHEADHARIETTSHRLVASFLGETLLSGHVAGDAAQRERLLATIERKAKQVRVQQATQPHLKANLLDALGRACATVDAFEPAESLIREAMSLRSAAFGKASLEYALSLGSLGQVCYRTGRLQEARAALIQSYELHKQCAPDVHTDVAQAANDLAAVERALGDRERARELHREALALRRDGGDPLLVAESLNNLANSEPSLERAAELLAEAYALREDTLGPDDPMTIQCMANRGSVALAAGNLESAKTLLGTAVERSRALGELGAEGLGASLRPLGYALLRLGDLAAARAAIEEAVGVESKRFGKDHPRVASVLEVRAKIDEKTGNWPLAVATWAEVLAIRRATLPQEHRDVGLASLSLGSAKVLAGAPSEGLADIDGALLILDRATETRSIDVADVQRMRAVALRRLDRASEAEAAVRVALQVLGDPPVDKARAQALTEHLRKLTEK